MALSFEEEVTVVVQSGNVHTAVRQCDRPAVLPSGGKLVVSHHVDPARRQRRGRGSSNSRHPYPPPSLRMRNTGLGTVPRSLSALPSGCRPCRPLSSPPWRHRQPARQVGSALAEYVERS